MSLKKFLIFLIFSGSCIAEENFHSSSYEVTDGSFQLILSEIGKKKIPKSIGSIADLEKLTIQMTEKKWFIHPPFPDWNRMIDEVPSNAMPKSITKLNRLRRLDVANLGLTKLPKNFDRLQNLDSLNLSMNFLKIDDELPTLKKLSNLRYLNIVGNRLDTLKIEQWQSENPMLQIVYKPSYKD